MAKKKQPHGAGPAVIDANPEDQHELSQVAEGDELPIADSWVPKFLDPKLDFFDALLTIPTGGWDKVSIYLYRLEPAVANKSGEKKYIGVYGTPISEESVKAEHGGGKYQAYVKSGTETLRNKTFWIAGEPIFKEGQTVRGGVAQGAPATALVAAGQQDIGAIVRQVIEATGGNSKAADAGIEVMKRAMMDGLEITKNIATRNQDSATGNSMGDKLVEALLPKLLAPPTPDPMLMKLFEAFISDRKAERRESNPAPEKTTPSNSLELVKELLGVESLREIVELGAIDRRTPWWVSVVSGAVEKLPLLVAEYSAMQERAFQRAIIAHQMGAGQQPGAAAPPPNMTRTDVARVQSQQAPPIPTQQSAGDMSTQMVNAIVEGICRAFDDGYPGDFAAAHIKMLYPQLVQQLAPLLGDPAQLQNFIANTPPLAERAADSEWQEFQQQFVDEVHQLFAPPPLEVVPREAVAAGAAPAAPRKVQQPAKKKANGSTV